MSRLLGLRAKPIPNLMVSARKPSPNFTKILSEIIGLRTKSIPNFEGRQSSLVVLSPRPSQSSSSACLAGLGLFHRPAPLSCPPGEARKARRYSRPALREPL
eukprot:7052913-Pyramimonas_sp.AAC.1